MPDRAEHGAQEQRSQSHGAETALELAAEPALGYMGPTDLPFDHDDVRVYIDNLFMEGYLKPYAAADHGLHLEHTDLTEWLRVGLRIDPEADRMRRVEGLLASIAASVPCARRARL